MKFFTPEWHGGDLSDEEAEQVPIRYREHLASLARVFPPAVIVLATELNLHDALVELVTVDGPRREVELHLRCGDLQVGYFLLRLRYQGVQADRLDQAALASIATDPETEVLYDEVDTSGTGFLHRVLVWPYREFAIEFTGLEVERLPTANRDVLYPAPDRFRQVGHGPA